jgi:SAM-dependent methyltransferase
MNCPVCNNDNFALYREVHSSLSAVPEGLDRGTTVHVTIERCSTCGLYRTNHLSDDRDAQELYESDSLSHDASSSKVKAAGARSTSSSDELRLLSTQPPATLLDIGCGAGQFLLRASSLGYNAQGIDPDPKSVAFVANELHLPARQGSIDVLSPNERFDVITTLGVLEHIDDPVAFLRGAAEHLAPGGEILVGVPNVDSLNRRVSHLSTHDWDMFLEPGHLYHYGPGTLRRLAQAAGLQAGRWGTATITIRGKLPLLPKRYPAIERVVRLIVASNPVTKRAYTTSLRALDRSNLGDMLFIVLRPNE